MSDLITKCSFPTAVHIVNTGEVQMRARLPDFKVYSGISRLLLAEFKFARFTLHDIRPRVWGHLGRNWTFKIGSR